jgi:hypothetical protein
LVECLAEYSRVVGVEENIREESVLEVKDEESV